jgi:hypothetical protein
LGSDEIDIPYPASLGNLAEWKDVFSDVKLSAALRPAAALRLGEVLRPQQQIVAQLLDGMGKLYCENSLLTTQPNDVTEMVQEMMLIRN